MLSWADNKGMMNSIELQRGAFWSWVVLLFGCDALRAAKLWCLTWPAIS